MNGHVAARGALVAVVALAIAGGLAACNVVVDAGSYHVVNTNGGDGASPEMEGGQPVSEGGQPVSEGGQPVSEGGVAPEGGQNGQGDGGPVGPCGSTPLPTTTAFQQLVTACVIAASCDQDLFAVNISTCISDDYLSAYPSLGCLASVTSCSGYYSCQATAVATPADCPDTASDNDEGSCSSSGVATSCYYYTGDFNTISNCAMLGGTCTVYDTDSEGDQAAGCLIGTCSDMDNNLHCKGTAEVYTCVNGKAYGQTCPPASLCGTFNGSSSCYYQSASCTTPGSACASDVLSVCSSSSAGGTTLANETVSYNCATSDLNCQTDDAGSGLCLSPGCAQSQCAEDCDTNTGLITYCVGGVPGTFDCTASGFSSCGTSTSGSTTFAYCLY